MNNPFKRFDLRDRNALSSNLYFQFSFLNALNWIFKLILWLESNWQTTSTHLEKIGFLYLLKSVLVFLLQSSSFKLTNKTTAPDSQSPGWRKKFEMFVPGFGKWRWIKILEVNFKPADSVHQSHYCQDVAKRRTPKLKEGPFWHLKSCNVCGGNYATCVYTCMYGNKPNREVIFLQESTKEAIHNLFLCFTNHQTIRHRPPTVVKQIIGFPTGYAVNNHQFRLTSQPNFWDPASYMWMS